MTPVSPQEVRAFIVNSIGDSLAANGLSGEMLPDDFDLLAHGGIGSLGFLRVITSVQEEFGVELDLEQIDPDEAKILGPLCGFIAESTASGR